MNRFETILTYSIFLHFDKHSTHAKQYGVIYKIHHTNLNEFKSSPQCHIFKILKLKINISILVPKYIMLENNDLTYHNFPEKYITRFFS